MRLLRKPLSIAALLLALLTASPATRVAGQTTGSYVAPRSGWIFVASSDLRHGTGHVMLIDPVAERVLWASEKGYETDLALSPSGDRLFLSYVRPAEGGMFTGTFEVIDTASGSVISSQGDPDPWPSNGSSRYASRMALSSEGRWLYRYKTHDAKAPRYYVQVFDTERGVFLPTVKDLPLCGFGSIVASESPKGVYVTCAMNQDVHFIKLADLSTPGGAASVDVDTGPDGEVLTAYTAADGVVTVIKGDGRFIKASFGATKAVRQGIVDQVLRGVAEQPAGVSRAQAKASDWLSTARIRTQQPVLSPDRSRVYLLVESKVGSQGITDHAVVLNSATLARLGTIRFSRPVGTMTISRDGRYLYAIDPDRAAMLVIDASSGRELRVISGLAPRPVFGVVVP